MSGMEKGKWDDLFDVTQVQIERSNNPSARNMLSMKDKLADLDPPITDPEQIAAIERIAATNITRSFVFQHIEFDAKAGTMTFHAVPMSFNIGTELLANALEILGAKKIQQCKLPPNNLGAVCFDVRIVEGAEEVARNLKKLGKSFNAVGGIGTGGPG